MYSPHPAPRASRSPHAGTIAALLAVTLTAALGCEDASRGTEPSPVGAWTLVGVGGEDLPAVFNSEGSQILSGGLFLEEDGTGEQDLAILDSAGAHQSVLYHWTWERTSNTLSLERVGDGLRATAGLEGGRLDLWPENFPPGSLQFER